MIYHEFCSVVRSIIAVYRNCSLYIEIEIICLFCKRVYVSFAKEPYKRSSAECRILQNGLQIYNRSYTYKIAFQILNLNVIFNLMSFDFISIQVQSRNFDIQRAISIYSDYRSDYRAEFMIDHSKSDL